MMTASKLSVYFTNTQEDLTIASDKLEAIVNTVLNIEGHKAQEVGVHFISDQEMRTLHADHFNDPSPTDCISFPIDDESETDYRVLGDIFVCPATAIQYATDNQIDTYKELTLYVVHGLLHLIGYDDIEEKDRLLMRQAENKAMAELTRMQLVLGSR